MTEKDAISKLWVALVEIEEYFQNGVIKQFQSKSSFSGEDAIIIKNAYSLLKQAEPFISNNIYKEAETTIVSSAEYFNELLDALRRALMEQDETRKIEIVSKTLNKILQKYRKNMEKVKKIIPSSIKEKDTNTGIVIHGGSFHNSNIIGTNIDSPLINLTISELIKKIDSSNLTNDEKKEIKDKINDILTHPLLASIIGSVSGAILS